MLVEGLNSLADVFGRLGFFGPKFGGGSTIFEP